MLLHAQFPVFHLATIAFSWNIGRVKAWHNHIIKLKPAFIIFSVLNERIIMSAFCCTHVNDNTFEVILIVLISYSFVVNSQLILVEIVNSPVMLLHLFQKILSTNVLLTILGHIKAHREIACIIKFNLAHSIIIKLKSLENYKQTIGQSFDCATLKSITFFVTWLAEISIITFKHLSFNKLFKRFLNRMLILDF